MPMTQPTSAGREEADNYQGVILRLDDTTRIIECRDGVQWIIQTKAPQAQRWRGRHYCRTRASLERLQSRHEEAISRAFPERI